MMSASAPGVYSRLPPRFLRRADGAIEGVWCSPFVMTPARFAVRLQTSSGWWIDGRMRQMPISDNASSGDAIRRKLRALRAVLLDPAATEPERANAEGLKARLEKRLRQGATPEGKWTGIMFRLGREVKEITSSPSPKGDWTDHAFRLGRMIRRNFKR